MITTYIEALFVIFYGGALSLLLWPSVKSLAVGTYRTLRGGYRRHCAFTGTKAWTGVLLSIGLGARLSIMEECKSTSELGPLTPLAVTHPIPLRLVADNSSLWPTESGRPMGGVVPGPTLPESAA